MTTLPTNAAFVGPTVTEAGFKASMTALRAYLAESLGTSGEPLAAMTALGTLTSSHVTAPSGALVMPASYRGAVVDLPDTVAVTLPSAATAGAGWACILRNTGADPVVFTRAGTDLIDGDTTRTLQSSAIGILMGTGTAWRWAMFNAPVGGTTNLAGRVMLTGAGGLLRELNVANHNLDNAHYGFFGNNGSAEPPTVQPDGNAGSARWAGLTAGVTNARMQLAARTTGTVTQIAAWWRPRDSSGWLAWRRFIDTRNLLGAVTQASGIPTGGAMGGNASTASPAGGRRSDLANGFRDQFAVLTSSDSADLTWTYNAAFMTDEVPIISIQPLGAGLRAELISVSATAMTFSVRNGAGDRVEAQTHLRAIGRWSDMT